MSVIDMDDERIRRESWCQRCGVDFTMSEWENRHSDYDGEDIHASCCEQEGPCSESAPAGG